MDDELNYFGKLFPSLEPIIIQSVIESFAPWHPSKRDTVVAALADMTGASPILPEEDTHEIEQRERQRRAAEATRRIQQDEEQRRHDEEKKRAEREEREARERRDQEVRARAEQERQRIEVERRRKEDAERKLREDAERRQKEIDEQLAKLEAERREKERLVEEERKRQIEKDMKDRADKLERERLEKERQQRAEAERIEKERQHAEKERQQAEGGGGGGGLLGWLGLGGGAKPKPTTTKDKRTDPVTPPTSLDNGSWIQINPNNNTTPTPNEATTAPPPPPPPARSTPPPGVPDDISFDSHGQNPEFERMLNHFMGTPVAVIDDTPLGTALPSRPAESKVTENDFKRMMDRYAEQSPIRQGSTEGSSTSWAPPAALEPTTVYGGAASGAQSDFEKMFAGFVDKERDPFAF